MKRFFQIFSEFARFVSKPGYFSQNILYSLYISRLTLAGGVVRFFLHRPAVKVHLETNGNKRTLFSSLVINYLVPFLIGTRQKRVLIRFLEVWPTISCNLKCDYCCAFSPLMKGTVPAEEMIRWIEIWSQKIVPLNFAISGGEPFLHSQLDLILNAVRRCWKNTRLEILTNGTFLTKVKAEIWESVRRNQVQVLVTKHFNYPEYNEKFFAGINVLKQNKITYSIRRSDQFWFKYYQKNNEGHPVPFKSNPCKAWKQCFSKIGTIEDNHLFYCGLLAHIIKARKENVIGAEWDVTLRHQPLQAECSYLDIVRYMYGGVIPECCVCAEQYEYIVPGELKVN
jgi:hypothetical protein